ncbi:sialin-like [Uloborus diversus]|uniref:sialin-like n=1 Tax=Uloborus diversus TaxID=327109 RepID=UPI0024097567|nr:sialin-like [Uloborus diversus]
MAPGYGSCETRNSQVRKISRAEEEPPLTPLLNRTGPRRFIAKRYIFSLLAFTACCLAVSFNMNLSIAIVSMVKRKVAFNKTTPNTTEVPQTNGSEIPKFNWNADIESLALGAVYYGQLVSFIPGGRMAELYGGKRMLCFCTLIASLATLVSPLAASCNAYAFVITRIFVGLGTGPIIPIVFYMLNRWIPHRERSFHASFILSGYGVGSFLAVIVSGALCGTHFLGGWPSVFYTGGLCGILWCLLCIFMMCETPETHPTISQEELEYIQIGIGTVKKEKILKIPWKEMALSVPLWALAIGFFGQFWLLGFFSTVHALYMGTVLNLPIVKNGILSCLPHLLRAIATCAASFPVDILLRSRTVSVGCVRKSATVINTVVSCAAFLGITMVGRNVTATTLLFILGGVLGEFVTFGVCLACIDIAPSLSGTVSGLINIVGVFPFFLIPVLVGAVTHYENSIRKWNTVFYISIAIVSVSTLIFVIFGDLKPQSWGVLQDTKPSNDDVNDEEPEETKAKEVELEDKRDLLNSSYHRL